MFLVRKGLPPALITLMNFLPWRFTSISAEFKISYKGEKNHISNSLVVQENLPNTNSCQAV